jgi:hypothetical protein
VTKALSSIQRPIDPVASLIIRDQHVEGGEKARARVGSPRRPCDPPCETRGSDLPVARSSQSTLRPDAHTRFRGTTVDRANRIAWTLYRAQDVAQCLLSAVGDRIELHITMTLDVVMSQQCSGPEQAAAVSSAWRLALVNRGWVDGRIATVRAKLDRRASERTA